jgi:hypothetical protein
MWIDSPRVLSTHGQHRGHAGRGQLYERLDRKASLQDALLNIIKEA